MTTHTVRAIATLTIQIDVSVSGTLSPEADTPSSRRVAMATARNAALDKFREIADKLGIVAQVVGEPMVRWVNEKVK